MLRRRGVIACVAAVLLGGLVYSNALHNPFIYDDYHLIVENRALASGNLKATVLHDVTRPAVALSYALDRRIWGPAPFGFHLTSVLLHVVNVALFAAFVWCGCEDRRRRRSGSVVRPWVTAPVAALFFAIHPMMTEAVGYISGRSELLCAFFFLIALHAARASLLTGRVLWKAATVACWLAALASKESALLLPIVVFLYDRWVAEELVAHTRRKLFYTTIFGLAAVLAIVRLVVFVSVEHGSSVGVEWSLIWVELEAVRQYVVLLLFPYAQSIFHDLSGAGPASVGVLIAVAGIIAAVSAAWRMRRHGLGRFGLIWFLLLLVPSSLLVLLDHGEPMAEHRVYLASMGFFLAGGVVIDRLVGALSGATGKLVLATMTIAYVIAFGGRTYLRNAVWSEPVGVWFEAAVQAPDSWFPALLLGEELHRAGQHEQAIGMFRRAIQLRPQEPDPHGKLGLCLAEMKDLDGAEAEFARQKQLNAQSTEATNGLATVSLLRGDLAKARDGYLETLKIEAANVAARRGLAGIEEAPGGDPAQALRWCEDIRRLAPETPGNDDCIRRNQARLATGTSGGS